MSGPSPPTQQSPSLGSQSEASVLGPGIAGLFIQGIETGLVFAQFSQWLVSHGRSGSSVSTAIIIFVTIVGLYVLTNALSRDLVIYCCSCSAQTGICFASAWHNYVQQFGEPVRVAFVASVTRL